MIYIIVETRKNEEEEMMICSFCGKQFKPEELKPSKYDDNPKLERVYCKRCLEYYVDDEILPWQKEM